MSLDARIQQIALAVISRVLAGGTATTGSPCADLRQETQDLHEHLHRALTLIDKLTARVEALEATRAEQAPARTARRKTGGTQP